MEHKTRIQVEIKKGKKLAIVVCDSVSAERDGVFCYWHDKFGGDACHKFSGKLTGAFHVTTDNEYVMNSEAMQLKKW